MRMPRLCGSQFLKGMPTRSTSAMYLQVSVSRPDLPLFVQFLVWQQFNCLSQSGSKKIWKCYAVLELQDAISFSYTIIFLYMFAFFKHFMIILQNCNPQRTNTLITVLPMYWIKNLFFKSCSARLCLLPSLVLTICKAGF